MGSSFFSFRNEDCFLFWLQNKTELSISVPTGVSHQRRNFFFAFIVKYKWIFSCLTIQINCYHFTLAFHHTWRKSLSQEEVEISCEGLKVHLKVVPKTLLQKRFENSPIMYKDIILRLKVRYWFITLLSAVYWKPDTFQAKVNLAKVVSLTSNLQCWHQMNHNHTSRGGGDWVLKMCYVPHSHPHTYCTL